jgi:hypothetical protein
MIQTGIHDGSELSIVPIGDVAHDGGGCGGRDDAIFLAQQPDRRIGHLFDTGARVKVLGFRSEGHEARTEIINGE